MSRVASRLGAFTLLLAGTFGTAYAVGEKLPGHSHTSTDDHAEDEHATDEHSIDEDSHDHSEMDMGGPVPPGFENGGFQLVTDGVSDGTATFHLKAADGTTVTDFTEAHGAVLHTIVIRPDLSDFNHVHPTIGADGSWSVEMPASGPWHVVFDSTPTGASGPIVVSANLDDEVAIDTVALPAPDDTAEVDTVEGDDMVITRVGFTFMLATADGGPVTGLELYLGQSSHLVAIRQGDLAYTHLHPSADMPDMFMFGGGITEPGTYRMFLQFGRNGEVLTVPFTVVIAEG